MDKEETDLPDETEDTGGLDREPVFYYSREHRLRRATPMVRELNEGKPLRPDFRKTVFGARSNTLLFLFVMVICGILFVMNSRFFVKDSNVKLGGNTLTVLIYREEGIPVLSIVKKAPKRGEAYWGPVDIAVSPMMPKTKDSEPVETPPVFLHRVNFNPVDSESFRISLPYEEASFFVIFKTDDEMKSIKL